VEVLAIFYAVGIPISVREAIAIEALASVVKALAFFIPAAWGYKMGECPVVDAIRLSSSFGLTFSLVRRLRELLWISLGLMVLLRHYGWRSRPA
jgi:hypothetical protein